MMNQRTPDLETFVQKQFDKKVEVLRKLHSFEDENFLCKDEQTNDNLMVLKLLSERPHLTEIAFKRQVKSRIDCVQHLKRKGFKCSEFVVGKDGQFVQDYTNSTDEGLNQHLLTVLYSFLPGKELEHSGYVHSQNALFQVGAFLGCFHAAFEDFNHDSNLIPFKDNAWHVSNYGLLVENVYINMVEDETIRLKLVTLLEYATRELDAARHVLRTGILHGDFHGMNVIVPEDFEVDSNTIKHLPPSNTSRYLPGQSGLSCEKDSDIIHSFARLVLNLKSSLGSLDCKELLRTYGLIDFEDISYSYLVLEVGRVVADAMVTFLLKTMNGVDSLKKSSLQSKVTLSDLEREPRAMAHGVVDRAQSQASIKSKVFQIGGWMICGYLMTNNLSMEEYNVILPAVSTSLCQYYILGTQAMKDNPSNSHYVGYCSKEALILLEWLHDMKPYDVYHIWNDAAHELISTLKQD